LAARKQKFSLVIDTLRRTGGHQAASAGAYNVAKENLSASKRGRAGPLNIPGFTAQTAQRNSQPAPLQCLDKNSLSNKLSLTGRGHLRHSSPTRGFDERRLPRVTNNKACQSTGPPEGFVFPQKKGTTMRHHITN
jgi:hypothetical protein